MFTIEEELYNACCDHDGDLERVKRLLADGADSNAKINGTSQLLLRRCVDIQKSFESYSIMVLT